MFDPILRVAILNSILEILGLFEIEWDWPQMYIESLMDFKIEVKMICSRHENQQFNDKLWRAMKSYEERGDSLQILFIDEEYSMSDRLSWGIQSDSRKAFDEIYPLYDCIYKAISDKQSKSARKSPSIIEDIMDTNFWLILILDHLDDGSASNLSHILDLASRINFNLILVSKDTDHPLLSLDKLASRCYIAHDLTEAEVQNIARFIFCTRNPGPLASERALYQSSYYIT